MNGTINIYSLGQDSKLSAEIILVVLFGKVCLILLKDEWNNKRCKTI
jgi:hypothetical protein